MSLIFSHDDVWVKAWESLQTGVKSKSITDDWAFVQSVSFDSDYKVSSTTQLGHTQDKDEVLGASHSLSLSGFDEGDVFDLANSKTIKYILELYFYDEEAQESVTYTMYDCTPKKATLADGDQNTVGREWKIGRYVKT